MTVHMPLDPGVAFDMLSILAVKHARTTGAAPAAANLAAFTTPLSGQLGEHLGQPLFNQITGSPEYRALYETNAALFDLIDELKSRPPQAADAVRVDCMNLHRWMDKAKLQARWFPYQPLSEQKLGYGDAATPLP